MLDAALGRRDAEGVRCDRLITRHVDKGERAPRAGQWTRADSFQKRYSDPAAKAAHTLASAECPSHHREVPWGAAFTMAGVSVAAAGLYGTLRYGPACVASLARVADCAHRGALAGALWWSLPSLMLAPRKVLALAPPTVRQRALRYNADMQNRRCLATLLVVHEIAASCLEVDCAGAGPVGCWLGLSVRYAPLAATFFYVFASGMGWGAFAPR